jgi:hypothetical protein
MSIIRINKTENYSIIHNECLKDSTISWRAKGLYAYMMTLPNGWNIRRGEIFNHAIEGKDAANKAFNELIQKGYIKKVFIREKGKIKGFEYILYEVANSTINEHSCTKNEQKYDKNNDKLLSKPNKINRRTEKPSVGKTDGLKNRPSVNPHLLNTNTKINTKNIINTNNPLNPPKGDLKVEKEFLHMVDESVRELFSDFLKIRKELKAKNTDRELFSDFLKIRKELKAKNTDRALNILINKLNKHSVKDQISMLERSIENSWKGLFDLTDTKKVKSSTKEDIIDCGTRYEESSYDQNMALINSFRKQG